MMTSDTRTPEQIEREIETQRSALSSNLEDLQDRFSIDTLVRQIGDQFREHGGDLGRSVTEQVKANPIPLALTGIGLAWLMFGNSRQPAAPGGISAAEDDYRRARIGQNRPYTPPVAHVADHRRGAPATGPSWARDERAAGRTPAADAAPAPAAPAAGHAAPRGGEDDAGPGRLASAASSAAETAADGAASARAAIGSGIEAVRHGVAEAGNRIAEGTETLTEEGRKRVIAARQKALEVRRATLRSAEHGVDAAADFYDRQPLVVGALAMAIGAALGGALPRSRVEDDLMGEQSDRLFAEAERIFEEEKAKAMEVARSVRDEVEDIADETRAELDSGAPGDKSAVEAAGDKARSAAGRVADAARTAAKDENLGKPKV